MKAPTLLLRRAPAPLGAPYADILIPWDEADAAHIAKLPIGESIAITVTKSRSLPQLRLYWSVLKHVAEASEWENAERLHVALKVRLGLYDVCKLPNGKMVPVVHSAAFDNMTHDEFTDYMTKAMDILCSEVVPGMDSAQLIAEAQASHGLRPVRAA